MKIAFEVESLIKDIFSKKIENPFVGLRPYEADEGHLFFGRDEQIKSLLEKLHTSRFVSVIGSSGCGKSSLIRAGVIPKLKGGFLTQKRDHWIIAMMRPAGNPLQSLANALKEAFRQDKELFANPLVKQLCSDTILQHGTTAFIEKLNDILCNNRFNLLLLVDQFEELFTYKTRSESKKNENVFFVNLLLNLNTAEDLPVYTVITMRSDYIGHCNRFFNLPERLNESQYLVPKLKWQQVNEVIDLPIKLCGQQINPGLLDLLTNDSDKEIDQLPVLQHCLMRTYKNWIDAGKKGDIDFIHYEKTGKLKGALCQHANEIYNKLDKEQQKITEYIFKVITEFSADYEPVRIPKKFKTLFEVCTAVKGVTREKVINVINIFRDKNCAFLVPPESVKDITDETRIDVSHESLLRQWDVLKNDKSKGDRENGWMIQEQRSADKLYWFSESASAEKKEYLGRLGVSEAEKWLNQQNPNEAWAKRYVNNIDEIKEYIKTSKTKTRLKNLLFYGSICLAAIAIVVALGFSAFNKAQSEKELSLFKASEAAKKQIDSINTKKKMDLINDQRKIDSINNQRKIDLINAQRKIDSINAQTFAALAAAKAAAKADSVNNALNSVFNRLPEILALVNEPFYKSDLFDSAKKNMYVDTLVKYRYELNDSIAFENQLSNLNKAVDIYNTAQKNPNKALLEAAKFNQVTKNKLSEYILVYVANNCGFSSKNILLSKAGYDYYNQPLPVISKERNFLAAVTNDSINVYNIINNELSLFKGVPIETNISSTKGNNMYSDVRGPGTIAFIDQNTVIAFLNNMIYKISLTDLSQTTMQIPNFTQNNVYERFYASSVSPNGKKLAIDYRNYNIKIWDIDSINKSPQLIKLDSLKGYVYNIKFSADAEKIIIQQRDKFIVRSLKTDLYYPPYDHIDLAADSTAENKYLIVQRNGVFELYDINDLNQTPISTLNFSEINIDTFKNAIAYAMKLSSDWKTFIIKASSEKNFSYSIKNTYYFKRNDNDSIFKLNREVNTKNFGRLVKMPYLNNSSIVVNGNRIIDTKSGYDEDTITFWKIYDTVANPAQLHYLVHTISSYTDTTEEKDDYKNINNIKDKEYLKKAVNTAIKKDTRALTKESLYDVKNLYRRLSELDTAAYLNRYRKVSGDYYNYYSDTAERIKDLKQITAAEEILLKHNPLELANESLSIDSLKKNLSLDYWNLSWYLILTKNFDSIVYMTTTAITLNDANNGINTNLALGYLLTGKCKQADSIYKKFKGEAYKSDIRKFTESFLQDLSDLEAREIITPDNKEVYKHVQKIRQYLKGETDKLDCDN